jgi:DNA invertase Pin-like site-specific DNA recombinase
MAWANRMERLAINERISAARDRPSWGRPRRLGAEAIAQARALRTEGRTLREIAVAMKVPKSDVTVKKAWT